MRLGSENRLDGIQNFGRFGFFQTVSDPSDGFPHRPNRKFISDKTDRAGTNQAHFYNRYKNNKSHKKMTSPKHCLHNGFGKYLYSTYSWGYNRFWQMNITSLQ
jgi:hypothetical protein